jgi:hypothetical protein
MHTSRGTDKTSSPFLKACKVTLKQLASSSLMWKFDVVDHLLRKEPTAESTNLEISMACDWILRCKLPHKLSLCLYAVCHFVSPHELEILKMNPTALSI